MSKRDSELRALYRKGFDLGLDGDSQQMLTTIQMRDMAIKQHQKYLAEINDWLRNQENSLKKRIQEVDRGADDINLTR